MSKKTNPKQKQEISSYEGRQDHIRELKLPAIETWENQYPDKEYVIDFTVPEFTCICPKTGLPDFASIQFIYIPHRDCIELKSFKEYILAYRELGIFHEHVVNKMLEDFVRYCKPMKLDIIGDFNPRGGIKTIVKASYVRPNSKRK